MWCLIYIMLMIQTGVTTSSGNEQPAEGESHQTPSSDSTDPLRGLTSTPRADPSPQSTVTAGKYTLFSDNKSRTWAIGFDVCPPPSFLRNAVTAGGDHSQSRADGEPAVWAGCQQSLAVPQPEPRPGCTGENWEC